MNLFDILGPVMVGPSSSHTAGAVRIGYITRKLLRAEPVRIALKLHGSFAATGAGHGTDKALVAGLLGMQPDDIRIPQAPALAAQRGIDVSQSVIALKDAHPNSVCIDVQAADGRKLEVVGASLGGGRVRICAIDGMTADFGGEYPTLVIQNDDRPGHVAAVSAALAALQVNIATLHMHRDKRGGLAVMIIECDDAIPEDARLALEHIRGIRRVSYL
ncbi:MAG: L-serine ammonia-lyase, iron-sulfur-dependent subunit beta, partial [Eubacteriales bacterium]|nr:L-serine ammonia-lyase, iron-sulfur-dependent subunit beta [Eubacteriales bacterium]